MFKKRNRLIEPSIEKSKKVKKLLKNAKNQIETKRINIVATYLRLWSIEKVYKATWCWKWTIEKAIKWYKEDPENFYKTKYPWRQKSNEWKEIEDKINRIIEEREKKWLATDIETVREIFNRRYKNIKILNYSQARYVVRQKLNFSYQKPYITDSRKPDNAEEILKERIEEGFEKVDELEKQRLKDKWLQNKKMKNW